MGHAVWVVVICIESLVPESFLAHLVGTWTYARCWNARPRVTV